MQNLITHIEENTSSLRVITEDPITIGLVVLVGGLIAHYTGRKVGRQQLSMQVVFDRYADKANEADGNVMDAIGVLGLKTDSSDDITRAFAARHSFTLALKRFAKTGADKDLKDARKAFVDYLDGAYDILKDKLPRTQKSLNRSLRRDLLSL